MKNRTPNNGNGPQSDGDSALSLQIASPLTVPTLEEQVRALQAAAQQHAERGAEQRHIQQQHADAAQKALDHINDLEQALRSCRADLANAENGEGAARVNAENHESQAVALVAQADDTRRLVAMLKPIAPPPIAPPAPLPLQSAGPQQSTQPDPLSSGTGGYPTAPAQGR